MIPLEYVLATATLVSPCEAPPAVIPCSLSSLQSIAVSMEILDPRELHYVFTVQQDSYQDLRMVHRRYETLRNAPPVCDSIRFPDRETIDRAITANRKLKQYLEGRYELYRDAWLLDAIADCDGAYTAWDLARDARCEWYHVSVRRKAILDLRDTIGPTQYYAGCLTPPLPAWAYRRMD